MSRYVIKESLECLLILHIIDHLTSLNGFFGIIYRMSRILSAVQSAFLCYKLGGRNIKYISHC